MMSNPSTAMGAIPCSALRFRRSRGSCCMRMPSGDIADTTASIWAVVGLAVLYRFLDDGRDGTTSAMGL